MQIGVLTSGGDAPGMNNAIRGVVRTALKSDCDVLGIKRGYAGLIDGDIDELEHGSVSSILEDGGTVLGTYRAKEFRHKSGRADAIATLNNYDVNGLVVIGGDGTIRGAQALNKQWDGQVLAIPASIDNDIGGTDYSIGFHSAVSTAVDAIDRIRDTATSHQRTFIVEVMGRNSGQIALAAGMAGGAEEILVPEVDYDINKIASRIQKVSERGKLHYIVVVAEGAADAHNLAKTLEDKSGKQSRPMILGHIQRGGAPAPLDRIAGSKLGHFAAKSLIDGCSGKMIGIKNDHPNPVPFKEAFSGKPITKNNLEVAAILSR